MKRTKEQTNILERLMIFTAGVACLSWVVAWVSLIFSVKFAFKVFIIAGIAMFVYMFIAVVWGIYLNVIRKKVVKITCNICDYFKRKENVDGNFEVNLHNPYLLYVTLHTSNLGTTNKEKLKSIIKSNIPREFCLIYEEILSE